MAKVPFPHEQRLPGWTPDWSSIGVNQVEHWPRHWGWKIASLSGEGFHGDDLDYRKALRNGKLPTACDEYGDPVTDYRPSWGTLPYAWKRGAYARTPPAWPFSLWAAILQHRADLPSEPWSWRVLHRAPAWWLLGPSGRQAAALIDRLWSLNAEEIESMRKNFDKAWEGSDRNEDAGAWYLARDFAVERFRERLRSLLLELT